MSTPTIDTSRGVARASALWWFADRLSVLNEATAIGQQIDRLERANGPNAEYDELRLRALVVCVNALHDLLVVLTPEPAIRH